MTRASMILFWLSLTIIVSLGLYHTSYRVEEMEQNLRSLNAEIEAERSSIHILKAEYVFLTNPSRIEEVAQKHLKLAPTTPSQITRLARLKDVAPTRAEAMGGTTVQGSPLASLRLRPAAHKPKASTEETGRLNTRLVLHKAAEGPSFALAASGDEP